MGRVFSLGMPADLGERNEGAALGDAGQVRLSHLPGDTSLHLACMQKDCSHFAWIPTWRTENALMFKTAKEKLFKWLVDVVGCCYIGHSVYIQCMKCPEENVLPGT